MAEKSSRLANILKQEYQSKGIAGGLASATGKRALEKLDIRNVLFGGSGVGSLIGRKIFGKGYSAINEKSSADKISSQSAILSADKLDTIGMNTQIAAKNSMALPSMARDMNVMRQNIIKMVRLQGGTPTNKADAFFSKAKDRESMYESIFGKKEKTTPTKVEQKQDNKGFLSTILSLGTSIFGVIGSALQKIPGLIASVFSAENIAKIFGIGTNVLSGISKMFTLIMNPTFLAIVAALGGAAWLANLISKKNDEANTEEKKLKRQAADNASQSSKLAARTLLIDEGLKSLLGEGFSDKDVSDYTRGEITSKAELKRLIEDAQSKGKKSIEITDSKVSAGAKQATRVGAGRGVQGGPTASQATTPSRFDGKANAESYLGAPISEDDWDMLVRAVYAESSQNQQEYANVMAVILNRVRKSGKSIPQVLNEENQFQAVTGARGEGPSPQFRKGPDSRSAEMILKSTESLNGISTSLDSFTAANVAAYGAVGGEVKFNKKMAQMQAANGKTIGGTVFAENLYRPSKSGETLNQSSTMMAALAREAQSGSANITTNNVVNNNGGQQGAPVQVAMADVVDYELGRMLTRMYE